MTAKRRVSVALTIILIIGVFALGRYYLSLFSREVSSYRERDKLILENYNTEIIEKLQSCESSENWQSVVESYNELTILVEDTDGTDIASTPGRESAPLDVKVLKVFTYRDEGYMIRSSVYSVRDDTTDSGHFIRMVIFALMAVISTAIFLVLLFYAFMLKPVYRLYDNMDLYEQGKKPKRTKGKTTTGKLQNRFVDMTETIDKHQENQRRIIASISHDIKTPLTSIMGYAEMLQKKDISEERKNRYLNTIYQKSTDIKAMIDVFDEYLGYKLSSELQLKIMTVAELIESLTGGCTDELSREGVRFICEKSDDKTVVEVDVQKMRRVFGNIISNSLKHFDTDNKVIRVETHHEEDGTVIVISDSGEGVDEDKLEVIFEPLYTSDEGRKVAGLGLSICKEIVESHGGTITARKSEMGGLAIVIKLKKV